MPIMQLTKLAGLCFAIAVALGLAGCAGEGSQRELAVVYSYATSAFTEPCGCCGGQMGGLPARAAYLRGFSERLSSSNDGGAGFEVLDGAAEAATDPGETYKFEFAGSAPADFVLLDCGSFTDLSLIHI